MPAMHLYTTKQAAAKLGVSPSTIQRHAKSHGIGFRNPNGNVFTDADIKRLSRAIADADANSRANIAWE